VVLASVYAMVSIGLKVGPNIQVWGVWLSSELNIWLNLN